MGHFSTAATMGSYYHHEGSWDSSTRQLPALEVIEKYTTTVDSLDFSAPFHNFYSPTAKFYNANGLVYSGGDAIWTWMKELFGVFSAVHHDIRRIRLLSVPAEEWSPASETQLVVLEAVTAFSMKSPAVAGKPIEVPRLLHFLVGKSEVEGQGTDGLQILQAKAWWDRGVLDRELARRKSQGGHAI